MLASSLLQLPALLLGRHQLCETLHLIPPSPLLAKSPSPQNPTAPASFFSNCSLFYFLTSLRKKASERLSSLFTLQITKQSYLLCVEWLDVQVRNTCLKHFHQMIKTALWGRLHCPPWVGKEAENSLRNSAPGVWIDGTEEMAPLVKYILLKH